MPFSLRRTTGGELSLTREHEKIALPRRGVTDFESFRKEDYAPLDLDRAAVAWETRAMQEFHSLALFTQISSQLHLLGAPLDWCGSFARMIEDEVRHTDLCLRMCGALGRPSSPQIIEADLHLASDRSLRAHVRDVVVSAFCIGETVSGVMFKRALRAATVPLARDVVAAILVDETFHGELGWELIALLMRGIVDEERAQLVARLPHLFAHYAKLCGAGAAVPGQGVRSPSSAKAAPQADPAPNFGTLTDAGYASAFFDAMEEDIVPGLCAVGLPEAERAHAELLSTFKE
jgi:hypothetical protein